MSSKEVPLKSADFDRRLRNRAGKEKQMRSDQRDPADSPYFRPCHVMGGGGPFLMLISPVAQGVYHTSNPGAQEDRFSKNPLASQPGLLERRRLSLTSAPF